MAAGVTKCFRPARSRLFLRAVTRIPVLKALGGIAFATLLVCALIALSGTAAALQETGGEPPTAEPAPGAGAGDAAAPPPPPPAVVPEGGSRRDRRSLRRLRRFG